MRFAVWEKLDYDEMVAAGDDDGDDASMTTDTGSDC